MAKAQVSNSQADSKSTCTADDDDDRSNEQQRWPPMIMMAQSWCLGCWLVKPLWMTNLLNDFLLCRGSFIWGYYTAKITAN